MTHSVWHFISITESLAKAGERREGGAVAESKEQKKANEKKEKS